MPLYEYICACGRAFDRVEPISRRHDVLCVCGEKPRIKIGKVLYRMAQPFRILDHNGNILHERQTIEKKPPLGYRHENPNLVEV